MSVMSLRGGWSSVSTLPHDGTPVILWMAHDEAPPRLPEPVGFWTINPTVGVGYWLIFGDPHAFAPIGKSADGSRFFAPETILSEFRKAPCGLCMDWLWWYVRQESTRGYRRLGCSRRDDWELSILPPTRLRSFLSPPRL